MKIATIGSGMIAKLFLDAVKIVDGVECVAVYSRNEQTAKELSEQYSIGKYYTDLDEMLDDPEVDFVYIASPNSLHFEQSKQALLKQKNVICEKPLTSTYKELVELIELAYERKLFFFEAITTIHLPNFKKFKTLLHEVGNVRMVFANFLQYSSRMDALKAGKVTNVFNPDFSGGALMDLNVYNLHFAVASFGKPESATYHPELHTNGIDVGGLLVLKYPDFIVSCAGGKHVQGQNNAVVYGEDGFIVIESEVSIFGSFKLNKNNEQLTFNEQAIENRMAYELADFKRVYESNDLKEYERWTNHSLEVYEILHSARLNAGIKFKDDEAR